MIYVVNKKTDSWCAQCLSIIENEHYTNTMQWLLVNNTGLTWSLVTFVHWPLMGNNKLNSEGCWTEIYISQNSAGTLGRALQILPHHAKRYLKWIAVFWKKKLQLNEADEACDIISFFLLALPPLFSSSEKKTFTPLKHFFFFQKYGRLLEISL